MITHSMEDVARMATRLIVMEHGESYLTPPREVFAQVDRLKEMGLEYRRSLNMHELHSRACLCRPISSHLTKQRRS